MTETSKKKIALKVKATPREPISNALAAKKLYGKADAKPATKK